VYISKNQNTIIMKKLGSKSDWRTATDEEKEALKFKFSLILNSTKAHKAIKGVGDLEGMSKHQQEKMARQIEDAILDVFLENMDEEIKMSEWVNTLSI
tara:strand:+ start:14246 stop:14539 length:294 start_codon:yes stop_codon:yes gene_type:complete